MAQKPLIDTLRRINDKVAEGKEPKKVQRAKDELAEMTRYYPLEAITFNRGAYIKLLSLKAIVAASEGETTANCSERINFENRIDPHRAAHLRIVERMMGEVRDHFTELGFRTDLERTSETNDAYTIPVGAVRTTVTIDWAQEPEAQAS